MAVTSIWPIKGRVDKVINYARNPEKTAEEYLGEQSAMHTIDGVVEYAADELKTEKLEYVTCLNCKEEDAVSQFVETKKYWQKTDGRVCYHGYQSFKSDEVDAATAHNVGVELAKELWGDRFEVVVATHCNTGHYHNHFVINSVSCVDGYKFYNSPEDYKRMREVSDRLCREARLSVIENPSGHGKHYARWQAEKEGKPTLPGMVAADIDRAIAASNTETAFWKLMREMGYQLILYKRNGEPRDEPSVRAPNAKKNTRLSTVGPDYSLERITERILNKVRKEVPFPEANEESRSKFRYRPEEHPKAKGLYALYLRYCYELHIIVRHPTSVKRVSSFLREDIIKLNHLSSQAEFLGRTGIATMPELIAYRDEKEARLAALYSERSELKNQLKRAQRKNDAPAEEAIKGKVAQISEQAKVLRKEAAICNEIAQRSGQIETNLAELQNQYDGKEITTDEHIRRSGGSGRENDTKRS